MNLIEKEMFNLLCKGKDLYGFTHVRAEFEAEGTRLDELFRLMEIGYKAGLKLSLKISGCESITDLYLARQAGASIVVTPMIESVYALKKYALACQKVFPVHQQYDTLFYFNIETHQAYQIASNLIATSVQDGLHGVVFGRVDFTASLGLDRTFIEKEVIREKAQEVALLCKKHGQSFILGGGMGPHSINTLTYFSPQTLEHFETRKIIFDNRLLSSSLLAEGLKCAAEFELLWLQNKKAYYAALQGEDKQRITFLQDRLTLTA